VTRLAFALSGAVLAFGEAGTVQFQTFGLGAPAAVLVHVATRVRLLRLGVERVTLNGARWLACFSFGEDVVHVFYNWFEHDLK
jgi:hypothetical protein